MEKLQKNLKSKKKKILESFSKQNQETHRSTIYFPYPSTFASNSADEHTHRDAAKNHDFKA